MPVIDRVTLLLLFTDVVVLSIAMATVHNTLLESVAFVAVVVFVLQGRALYRSRLTLSVIDDIPGLTFAVVAGASVSGSLALAGGQTTAGTVLLGGLLGAVLLLVARTAVYILIRLARREGWVSHRTVIVGTGPTAARLSDLIEANPDHGLRVVGFVGSEAESVDGVDSDQVIEEDVSQLAAVARKHRASVVLVTLGGVRIPSVLKVLRQRGAKTGYTLFLVPALFQMMHTRRTDRMRDIALIRLRPSPVQVLSWKLKRLFDVVASALGLLPLLPLLALLAVAVRAETGGVLFRQTRVGRDGKLFTLYKFQSMRPANARESKQRWNIAADDRIGPVGRFIRRTSLDELPQLVNVLRGDMSLVGPRPERPYFVERFNEKYDDSYPMRHRVRPGLTGWAAVNGLRGDTSIEERAYFDNVYIDNWSLWLDAQILARTVAAVLGAQGR